MFQIDVVIVGGGPAGLNAALTLGRARRRVLLVDNGQPRNAPAQAVHGFLTRDGTPPAELRRIGREQLAPYPTVEVRDTEVVAVDALGEPSGGGFVVSLADQSVTRTRRLLLATGLADQLPAIDGLAGLWATASCTAPTGPPSQPAGCGRPGGDGRRRGRHRRGRDRPEPARRRPARPPPALGRLTAGRQRPDPNRVSVEARPCELSSQPPRRRDRSG
jgi:hypothetical protein